jgi:hypothetical protein
MQYAITIPTETTCLDEIKLAELDVLRCLTGAILANMTAGGRSSAEVCAWLVHLSVALQTYESAALAIERDMVDYNEPDTYEWWNDHVKAVHRAMRMVANKSWCVDATHVDGVYRVLVEV